VQDARGEQQQQVEVTSHHRAAVVGEQAGEQVAANAVVGHGGRFGGGHQRQRRVGPRRRGQGEDVGAQACSGHAPIVACAGATLPVADVLYVDDGDVLTSAGVSCGIDLCLHIVRRDLGAHAANTVARAIVAAPHREGGQAQYVRAPVGRHESSSLAPVREWALEHLHEPLTVALLARRAGVSGRTFARRFTEETGRSPMRWLLDAWLDVARELLEQGDAGVEHIARRSGLGTATNLRLHFRRRFATTPTAYRRAFGRRGA
jgi:AraC-like DNA-binding protein